eukprot:CAMPEP_0198341942 /NCGR_PEP_ID=MMETSP1450-20131203/50389_1 /TAXON_ID=753684 ORGANISM="Madagascaria erythrocladiodes, Strain CCMP3234" /NCGR_SAMPLE_ID=MMETSP1450 /ASSEMBLY_ACC=CAM_ASM_001115 /LENGTH=106 /DNA_ID=CAMNT_0044047003 /DNA_START=164 /DNA_END=484 /DNA_ORIENTATION=-
MMRHFTSGRAAKEKQQRESQLQRALGADKVLRCYACTTSIATLDEVAKGDAEAKYAYVCNWCTHGRHGDSDEKRLLVACENCSTGEEHSFIKTLVNALATTPASTT